MYVVVLAYSDHGIVMISCSADVDVRYEFGYSASPTG